ncbi:MAG: hypothetical protein HYZ75_09740 [Elusimicrobia bacterium]|nr:hypothetical protein [Elusimicrobiota bacterium]
MEVPNPSARGPKPESSGFGTLVVGAVLVGGAFLAIKAYQARQTPAAEPTLKAEVALARPDPLPGGPKKEEEAGPVDSLEMVKRSQDYSGVAVRGPMANSRPEPPLSYDGDTGPARAGTRLIRTKKEWDALWRETGGHDMPVVDWARYLGVAVFAGTRPAGSKIALTVGKPDRGRFEVRWKVAEPKSEEAGDARPFRVILVPKTHGTPTFKEAR